MGSERMTEECHRCVMNQSTFFSILSEKVLKLQLSRARERTSSCGRFVKYCRGPRPRNSLSDEGKCVFLKNKKKEKKKKELLKHTVLLYFTVRCG